MRLPASVCAVLGVAVFLVAGCHRETPIERGAREFRAKQKSRMEQAQLQTTLFATLTDRGMVFADRKHGRSLAIRPEKTELHAGEPLKIHLVFGNVDVRNPVSVGCTGFSLTEEDEKTGLSTSADLNVLCSSDDLLHNNNTLLKRGEMRTADISTGGTKLSFDHPGRYIVQAAWQTSSPAEGMLVRGNPYPAIASNEVLITVR